jgi:CRISPR system Cascade subunit CasE
MHALHRVPPAERAAAGSGWTHEAGLAWLARKGVVAGFEIDPDELYVGDYEQIRMPRDGRRPATLGILSFRGMLTVTEPELFLASLVQGFGAARGFGCGLMLIRRGA